MGKAGRARVEALLRMSETGGELILPMSFIPVAERYDLMRTIDRWVVERAFSDFKRLAKLRGDAAPAEFSISTHVRSLHRSSTCSIAGTTRADTAAAGHADPEWRALMAFQAARARAYYE